MKKIAVIIIFLLIPFFVPAGDTTFFDSVKIAFGGAKVKPIEIISRNMPAWTNDDCGGKTPAVFANNSNYEDKWRACGRASEKKPVWLAYDLSGVPEKKRSDVLLVWYNEDTSPYDHTLITAISNPGYNNPGNYCIELNSAPGGKAPDSGWVRFVTMNDNTLHSGQHRLLMKGYNWIRFVALKSDGSKGNDGIAVNMDVYDSSKGTADNWLFIGDSITQMSMNHFAFENPAGRGTFAELINGREERYFPIQENGGTGYMTSVDGAKNIGSWLTVFPGKYVAISYGTNDAWNNMAPEEFYRNYEIMVQTVIKYGKVPLVPRSIPWSTSQEKIQVHGALLDAQLKRLFKKYPAIIKGPDFREYYRNNPEMLSKDGVHPSWPDGLFMYRKLWAEAALKEVY